MNEHIEKEALIKAIQEDYNIRMHEMYKEEIFKGTTAKFIVTALTMNLKVL